MSTAPAHEPSESELEVARAHTCYPVDPVSLGQPDGRHRRVEHSAGDVDASYRTQSFLMTWEGVRQRLSPNGPGAGPSATLHLLTAWNAGGRRYTYDENVQAQERLRGLLGGRVVTVAVALPPDHRWFEEVLVVRDLEQHEAVELGMAFEQPAIVAWDEGRLMVIPTSAASVVAGSTMPAGLSVVPRSCPIRDDDDPAGRCVARGGPWVSASIHAHSLWRNQRAVGVRLLGCEPCRDGRLPAWGVGGGSIDIQGPCVGSRFGGASWR